MPTFPKISIVTPNFNGAKYLECTINSVLGQNYPNLEYIIIDGGSSDKSIEIIKKYESSLSYWVSEPDLGMYDALQKGFNKSSGDIMAWLNSDDLYHSKALYVVAELFANSQVKWIMGYPTSFDEIGRASSPTCFPRSWYPLRYYFGDIGTIQQESVFWHRSIWEKAGANIHTQYKYAGDMYLWSRFFEFEKLYITNSLIGGFRRCNSNNQLSVKYASRYNLETKQIIKNQSVNVQDKHLLFIKRIINLSIRIINKISIFNAGNIERQLFKRILNIPKLILYDEIKRKFVFK